MKKKSLHIENVGLDIVDEIKECLISNRFSYINLGDQAVGFYTWHNIGDKILINNMFIKPEFRGKIDIKRRLKEFMKSHKGKVYWHNNRQDRFHYCKGGI